MYILILLCTTYILMYLNLSSDIINVRNSYRLILSIHEIVKSAKLAGTVTAYFRERCGAERKE